ncbi:hypothetical protein BP5796_06866 [Coleophoma crateriformis]|uniref:Zn(2)-C6 fungal-type domain-containing protein n=1 Tax=Coleophoma crateriformis TaxID=565419 RepID=A0A3D8RPW5_9HELO|nr:hypothetical protein BP5796_06866 [Coleophoma crateriformis]
MATNSHGSTLSTRAPGFDPTESSPRSVDAAIALVPTLKRRRAGAPKTKTGCQTCRTRRIKCDEAKPACNRCQKSGIACPGYTSPKPKRVAIRSVQYRPLAPSHSNPPALKPAPVPVECRSVVLNKSLSPYTAVFENEREFYYFNSFCMDFLPAVPGYLLPPSTWSRMVLQETQHELCLRQAISALSALITSLSTGSNDVPSAQASKSNLPNNDHRNYAIRLYQKAIRGMRMIVSPRAALLACLAIFIFETLSDRCDLAIGQIQNGLKLLERLSTNSQAGTWSKRALELTSPVLYIEDDLVRILVNLEISLLPFARSKPLPCQREFYQNISPERENIPRAGFESFTTAKDSLERIMARGIDTQAFGVPWRHHTNSPTFEGQGESWRSVSSMFSSLASIELCFHETDAWLTAMRQLCARAPLSRNSEDFMHAISMQLQAKTTKILLARRLFTFECQFDTLNQDFSEIVQLCEEYITHPFYKRPAPKVVISRYGAILPLFLVVGRCRERKVRRKALQMLAGLKRREGILDSEAWSRLGSWIIDLEEDGLEEGLSIPEERRVRLSKIKIDAQTKTLEALVEKNVETGGFIEIPTRIQW